MNSLFDAPWTIALGWTLIHSLWQGSLIAILYLVFKSLSRGNQAHIRYIGGLFAISMIMFGSAFTYLHQLPKTTHIDHGALVILNESQDDGNVSYDVTVPAKSLVEVDSSFNQQLHLYIPWLTITWLLGISMMAFRFLLQIKHLRNLRRDGLSDIDASWGIRLNSLAKKLGLEHASIKLSNIIDQPLTLGFFKPLILIPSSMLSGFSPEEIESIFLHELAHIQRHDFIINLIQSLIELLFFFHPAVWWLSREIRHEREIACDEFVIKHTQDAFTHADALMHLQRYKIHQKQVLVLGAKGGKFAQRIQHLLKSHSKPDYRRGLLGMLIIILGLIGISMIPIMTMEKPDNFNLEGEFTGFADSTWLYFGVFKEGISNRKSHDSAMVLNGRVSLSMHLPSVPSEAILSNKKFDTYKLFWVQPGTITIQGDSANFKESKISGSDMESLKETIEKVKGNKKLSIIEQFIDQMPAVYALYWEREKTSLKNLQRIYNLIPEELNNYLYTKKIYHFLESRGTNIPKVGDPIVDFEVFDQDGKDYKLSAFPNRFTLLHFGHQPGFVSKDLHQLADEFEDKLQVISFSWETIPSRWRAGLNKLPKEAHESSVLYVWDGEGEAGPLYPIYGDGGFPAFYLLNGDGVVIDKWLGTTDYRKGKWKKHLKN